MLVATAVLEEAGHEFIPFSVKNSKNVKTPYEKYFAEPIGGKDLVYYKDYKKTPKTMIEILGRGYYSLHVKKRLSELIEKEKPDIAYILHHFNKLSPSIVDACKKKGLPVIMRISDFFLVCPEAHLYRDGQICEECIDKSLFRCIRHACIKSSIPASIVKASATWLHRFMKIYQKCDYVVCPSPFTLEKLVPIFGKRKLVFIPTLAHNLHDYNAGVGDYALFVGRLEPQKGVMLAIEAVADTGIKLKIAGSSSTGYEKQVKEYASRFNNVELLGNVDQHRLKKLYTNARVVLIPSLWYENLPNVAIEAMQYSRPIIASNLGSMPYVVKNGINGYSLDPNARKFKERLLTLYNDINLCKLIGRKAYEESIDTYNP